MKKSLGSFIALNRRAVLMLGVVVSLAVFGIATWRTSAWTAPVGSIEGGEKASMAESGDPEWARALEEHIKNGTFEMMSSAKQLQLQLKAGMKYEDGVLKPGIPNDVRPYAKLFDTKRLETLASSEGILTALANPLVNNPALDLTAQKTQSETTLLLIGGNNLVASYNDSGSFLGGVNSFTGYSTTTDMGTTWTDRGIVPLLGQQNFGDPVLARSAATGSVFLATLSGGTNGMNIYKSTDSGVTFTTVADGAPGSSGSANTDKEWIAVDNFAGPGNGNVYHTYRDFGAGAFSGIWFTRSTNDGGLFSAPILIASGAAGNVQGPFVFVGADHAVYVAFYDSQTTPDRIAIRKSTDLGLTFGAPVLVSNLTTTGTNGSLNVPAGYRSSAFPSCAASVANANLLVCVHGDITVAGGPDSNIIYNQSSDGGATWSANSIISTDPGTNVQTHPAITIMPDGSALSATWQDSRADAANRRVQRFGVIGTIAGTTVTFGPNFQVSQPNWTPIFGADPVVNTVYMGDYDQMDADNSNFYSTFVDCRNTADGQDVRFAKIPKAGPGAIIGFRSSNVTTLNPANNSCTDLFVTLANNGTANAPAVTANFTTVTPGVTLTQNTGVAYGTINAGATAVNAVPIKMSVANNFVCGTPIVIDVVASTGEAFSFNVNTQGLGYAITTAAGQTINGGTTRVDGVGGDDTVTSGVAIPFPFPFNGTNFNTINVSSNGNAQFTSTSTVFTNACPLPSAALNNLLAGHWDDLRTDRAGGGIFTSVTGSTPNRVFNIEWRAVTFSTPESPIVFEIRLYETGGIIEYVYSNVTGNATNMNGSSATVGVQKGTGAVPATDVSQFSCNTASLSNGFLVRFTPVSACPQGNGTCPLGASADLAITKTDGVTTVTAGQNITYTIVARNNGPSAVTGATVTDTFPAALTGVTWTCVGAGGGTCTAAGAGNINDTAVNLPVGGTATYTATATVNPAATFGFSNTAMVTAPIGTTDPVPANNSARDTDTICPPGVVPVTNEVEPNGTSATAQVLTLNAGNNNSAIVAASIAPANDVDFFTFTAPAGSRVWVETDTGGTQNPGATSRDTVFDLLAADGTTVIENDDDDGTGNGGDGTVETGLASMIGGRTLTAGGTYFIRVRAFSATGIVDPYRLFLTVTNVAATPETEANNTAATANPIVTAGSSTGLISGNIATGGDVDYFSVVANAGERVYFNADGDPGRTGTGTDLVVEFRDPADALLLTVDSSITGSLTNPAAEGANFTVGPAGTYFVRVRHFSVTGVGTYHLMVTNGRTTGTCQPTAAGVTVSGRVLTPDGYGLRNASVSITDSSGMTRTARTSSFGYYTFENVEVGGTYVVSVGSKRYSFAPRTITVNDAVSDFDFTAQGPSQ